MPKPPNLTDVNFSPNIRQPSRLSMDISNQIRDAIIEGKLEGGQRLIESELTRIFGVSRSPVRDALQILSLEGLVDLEPYRGARVSVVEPEAAREHFEIKGMVEGFAASLATDRFTADDIRELTDIHQEMKAQKDAMNFRDMTEANFNFHRKIIDGVHNQSLIRFYRSISHNIRRFGLLGMTEKEEVWALSWQEHDEILEAICARESEQAEALSPASRPERVQKGDGPG